MFHSVGFGKTAITLAMIYHRQKADKQWANQKGNGVDDGTIRLKATIILVPPTLCMQWKEEVDKFLGTQQKGDVLILERIINLKSKTVADFRAAKIVIVNWNLFEND